MTAVAMTTPHGWLLVAAVLLPFIGMMVGLVAGGRHAARVAAVVIIAGLAIAAVTVRAVLDALPVDPSLPALLAAPGVVHGQWALYHGCPVSLAAPGATLHIGDDPVLDIDGALAAAPGLKTLGERYGDLTLYTGCIDAELDAEQRIVPGLGDAGDRLYGRPQAGSVG